MDAVGFCLVWCNFCKNVAIFSLFLLSILPLGMKSMVLFPFGVCALTLWASLPRSLENSVIHVSDSGTCHNSLYSWDIQVMVSITSLALKQLHASCVVRIFVVRAYLEAVWPKLGC